VTAKKEKKDIIQLKVLNWFMFKAGKIRLVKNITKILQKA